MNKKIAVVIPCYKVERHILQVLSSIGDEVSLIYVVDDCCPDGSGDYVEKNQSDPRVQIIRNKVNLGVGGAVMAGYRQSLKDGAGVIVKIDGDGQMDPSLIWHFVGPIFNGDADYTKGNRFYNPENVRMMPATRIFGNLALSFITKFSSGYWNVFDPTNGYTAIHCEILKVLPLDKISNRYFFESDMLFRLNIMQAKVVDIAMKAVYSDEVSHLKVSSVIPQFFFHNFKNGFKRILYNYFLRDFSVASMELVLGFLLFSFGVIFGFTEWMIHSAAGQYASTGTVMLAVLPIISGMQLLLSFVNFDVMAVPSIAQSRLSHYKLNSYQSETDET
ncbi:MAG: glycosyltransferase involved in cell wall biosynthesis [Paraglaciecola sp.]|jgi:glycosyltransferase involved in cell wall biosynthesis